MPSSIYARYYLPVAQAITTQIERYPSAADLSIAESLKKRVPACSALPDNGACSDCADPYGYPDAENLHVASPPSPVVEVEFKRKRKSLFYNEKELTLRLGDYVVVEADRGLDLGKVCAVGRVALRKLEKQYHGQFPHFRVVRVATKADLEKARQNRADEPKAMVICRQQIAYHKLTEMKLVDAEWQFDRKRITFYFTAPHQVDFRRLVRSLASRFRARIELRQISPREVARRFGDVGICGQELCCTTFLSTAQHITISAAETQQLPLTPSRLSGVCGRLKCCLLYELELYVEALKEFPPLHSIVELEEDRGQIVKVDIFRKTVSIFLENAQSYQELSLDEVRTLWESGKVHPPAGQMPAVAMQPLGTEEETLNPEELED